MNVWQSLRRLFGDRSGTNAPAAPPAQLRNRPGGMAWITGVTGPGGFEAMNNRAVRTVQFDGDCWQIDPPQEVFVTRPTFMRATGSLFMPGQVATVTGLGDDLLEPWKDIGDDERDQSLAYLPPVPAAAPRRLPDIVRLPVREMQGRA